MAHRPCDCWPFVSFSKASHSALLMEHERICYLCIYLLLICTYCDGVVRKKMSKNTAQEEISGTRVRDRERCERERYRSHLKKASIRNKSDLENGRAARRRRRYRTETKRLRSSHRPVAAAATTNNKTTYVYVHIERKSRSAQLHSPGLYAWAATEKIAVKWISHV